MRRLLLLLLALYVSTPMVFQSFVPLIAQTAQAAPGEETEEDSLVSPEDSYPSGADDVTWNVNSLSEFAAMEEVSGCLERSPQDEKAIQDKKVDIRTIRYLNYLVTPVDNQDGAPGAGLCPVKVGRVVKGYDTDGVGKFDRESAEAVEEDNRSLSAHNKGQAVDITEVGEVTCKIVEHKRGIPTTFGSIGGGAKTKWQAPRPVKVAWQSVDGIGRNPTPRSPSLMETSTALTAESIAHIFNEAGEIESYVDYVRGLDINTVLAYVGANIFLKHGGLSKITTDPLSGDLVSIIGAASLEKSLPDLPDGLSQADGSEDVRVAAAKARLEEALNLPGGSLKGYGWDSILESTGKRTLENALGLPSGHFDQFSLPEVTGDEMMQGALERWQRGDEAFNFIPGTLQKIRSNDAGGFKMAGVNTLSASFNLTSEQKEELTRKSQTGQQPDIDPLGFPVPKEFPSDGLRNLFSQNPTEQRQSEEALKSYGIELVRSAVNKNIPRQYEGITENLIAEVLNPKRTISVDSLKRSVASEKLGNDLGLDMSERRKIANNQRSAKFERSLANHLNEELGLTGESRITNEDIRQNLSEGVLSWAEKIGGVQADKTFNWPSDTGIKVIKGEVPLKDALEDGFANSVAEMIGLSRGSGFSMRGDLQESYGHALVKERMGLDVERGQKAENIDQDDLYAAFGLSASRPLAALRNDSTFWSSEGTVRALTLSDARLGIESGTSEKFLRGEITVDALASKAAADNLRNLTIDSVWNYFNLEGDFRLRVDGNRIVLNAGRFDERKIDIFNVMGNWGSATQDDKDIVLGLAKQITGRSLDSKALFAVDFFYKYSQAPTQVEAMSLLIDQGIRQLALAFGGNIEGFDAGALGEMADEITAVFNGGGNDFVARDGQIVSKKEALLRRIVKATNIPSQYQEDAAAFIGGDFRTGFAAWSAVMWSEFANKYLPEDSPLTYEEIRTTFNFDSPELIEERIRELAQELNLTNFSAEQYRDLLSRARRELIQEAKDNAQYKLSDAMIEKATGQEVPADFSRVMFTGTSQERSELLISFGMAQLEAAFKRINPAYVTGTLEKIFRGEIPSFSSEQLILSILNQSGASFEPFTKGFASQFYNFVKAGDKDSFFTDPNYSLMWNQFDSWIEDGLGIEGLPKGFSKSLYLAYENNWDFDARITGSNGEVAVPSLTDIGKQLLTEKLTEWGDKVFGFPAGTVANIYRAYTAVDNAERAYFAAKAIGGDAAKLADAANNLSKAQKELTLVIITIALNACEACQQFFSSIDKAIQAPPGFTNALVAGAIAFALGLGPAGLIMAAIIFFFGVYKVEYLCPVPPPDNYALASYDPEYDQLEYVWGDSYTDETRAVQGSPPRGVDRNDWAGSVSFADGNDPDLWRAWARYFTGQLLEATISYGEDRPRPLKPLQVITYRRANAEYFYSRIDAAFGNVAASYPFAGLGYSQSTTRITDSVHVGFGGAF